MERVEIGCQGPNLGLGEPVGGVDQPSINVLTHSGQDQAEEPTIAASGLGLEQVAVIFLALDGAFGARASIEVALPEDTIPGNEGVEAVVFFGVGINDPAIE